MAGARLSPGEGRGIEDEGFGLNKYNEGAREGQKKTRSAILNRSWRCPLDKRRCQQGNRVLNLAFWEGVWVRNRHLGVLGV